MEIEGYRGSKSVQNRDLALISYFTGTRAFVIREIGIKSLHWSFLKP